MENERKNRTQQTIAKNESEDFSMERADEDDKEAVQRAKKVDQRQEK